MSHIQAILVPKQTAFSSDLERLGDALGTWVESEQTRGVMAMCSPGATDLREGELPQPLAVQEAMGQFRIPREARDLLKSKGDNSMLTEEEAEDLGVGFDGPKPGAIPEQLEKLGDVGRVRCVILLHQAPSDNPREAFVNSMEKHIPLDVVEDIFIDGKRWK